MGCRDCSRCTEPIGNTLVMLPIRFVMLLTFAWNVGLLQRRCPNCKHSLGCHSHR